ncbi:MAG: TIGR01627 domain-containing protein [Okeania sp. SIO3C4]|nr:TIGR01627 domain-containing protein [Okeania sp. SIO3C4]
MEQSLQIFNLILLPQQLQILHFTIMSESETHKKLQNLPEKLWEKKKELTEYKYRLSQAKTNLKKSKSPPHQTKLQKHKSTTNQPLKSVVKKSMSVQEITAERQPHSLPSEKYKNKLAKLSGCHSDEYSYIINTISQKTPTNFLIFGVGKDSEIWINLNKKGKTVFIEDNPKWFEWAKETYPGIKAYLVDYRTKVKNWLDLLTKYSNGKECLSMIMPKEIWQTKWDFIFIDAPAGYSEEMPGRMKSIYLGAKLAFQTRNTDIFVHDCHRQVENIYSSYFFHQENLVTEIRRLRHYKITGKVNSIREDSQKIESKEQVEISSVKLFKPVSNLLHGCYLDRPKPGEKFNQQTIKLMGWVVGKKSPAVAVEVISNGQVIQTVPIDKQRSGVAKGYPKVSLAKTSGFATNIAVIDLAKESELRLQAILKDKSRVALGVLELNFKSDKSIGVIYIATGERFIREACHSVASLKAQMPNMPVTIFASKDIKNSNFDRVVVIEKPDYNHIDKIKYMSASPYDYTLFIDTDTYISADFAEIFTLLDKFDMGVAHAPMNIRGFVNGVPESFQQFNTGVILYKKSAEMKQLFSQWLELYNPPNPDQPTFREALYYSKLRIATLAPEYNCRFPFPGAVSGIVKILHGRHENLPLVAEKINSGKRLRIINPKQFKHIENFSQS